MAYSPSFALFTVFFLLVQFGNNVSGAAYQGFIPDIVPEAERGVASGYMGVMSMTGTIAALALAGALVRPGHAAGFYWLIVLVLAAGLAVTLWRVPDSPAGEGMPSWREFWRSFWISPRRYPDFAWVFLTRALVMLSFYTLLSFLEYYLKDVLHLAGYVAGTTMVGAAVMLGATASTLLSGYLSDRVGRKPIVAAAGGLMGLTALVFLLVHSWPVVLAFGVVFGLGYGAYISVDWALAVDVLPSERSAARDLGIWSIAITLPQVVAPFIGGQLIYRLAGLGPVVGYQAIYAAAFLYALAGSVLIFRVRGAR